MKKKSLDNLEQYTKDELIFYIRQTSALWNHKPQDIILRYRIDKNDEEVSKILNEIKILVAQIEKFAKQGKKLFDDDVIEIIRQRETLSKKVDKLWAENDKYSKILYGD